MSPSTEEKTIRALGWTFVFRRVSPFGYPRATVKHKSEKLIVSIGASAEHGETRRELAAMLLADIRGEIYKESKQLTQPEIEKAEGLSQGIPE